MHYAIAAFKNISFRIARMAAARLERKIFALDQILEDLCGMHDSVLSCLHKWKKLNGMTLAEKSIFFEAKKSIYEEVLSISDFDEFLELVEIDYAHHLRKSEELERRYMLLSLERNKLMVRLNRLLRRSVVEENFRSHYAGALLIPPDTLQWDAPLGVDDEEGLEDQLLAGR